MKSIIARIRMMLEEGGDSLSSYIAFSKAIRGQKFSRRSIKDNFRKFVDKEDWTGSNEEEILEHLYKVAEDDRK